MLVELGDVNSRSSIATNTPAGSMAWGGVRFSAGGENPDWLLIVNEPLVTGTKLPPQRRILVETEPPGIKTYWEPYEDQFGIVLTPFPRAGGRSEKIETHPCLSWFYGLDFEAVRFSLNYDDLLSLPRMPKPGLLSAVLSRKTATPLHRKRIEFALMLKKRLGDRFEIYGQGFRPIGDKRQAIDPFRYHLAIENTVAGHYWTEKLADPLLGWSLPIYCGAPAAPQYFPDGSFETLDLDGSLDAAVDRVARLLDEDPYESRIAAIAEARRRVLQEYSLPAVISKIVTERSLPFDPLPRPAPIRRSRHFRPLHSYFRSPVPKWRQSLFKRLR